MGLLLFAEDNKNLHRIILLYVYVDDGDGHVFGWNKNGQLGVPPCEDVTVPHPLTTSKLPHSPTIRVMKVSCGWNHTLAIGDGGCLIAWGSNAFGQLGVPDVAKQTERPVVLQQQVGEDHHVHTWAVWVILDVDLGQAHILQL